jgi:hypothetical protein
MMTLDETPPEAVQTAESDRSSPQKLTRRWKGKLIGSGIALVLVGGAAALLMHGIESARENAARSS